MDIRNRTQLRQFAAERLESARDAQKIVTIYAAIIIGMSVAAALVNYVLGLQIDQTGGLSNIGTRTVLSSLQTMLPLVQTVVSICLQLGYTSAMLRIARGQYASPNSLRLGFDRFWVLLRYTILYNAILMGMGFASLYLGMTIFAMTPLSRPAMELITPLLSQNTLINAAVTIPDTLYSQLLRSMIPAFLICIVVFCLLCVPTLYRMRMATYVIIDKPGIGALAALRESKKMMRRNCLHLFKLDLSMWWFYLSLILASVVCYGDMILPMLGIELPFSSDVNFFLFYGLYWALDFVIFYYLRNPVEVTYALAYDSIRPQEKPQDGGVVLGNIFQM